MMKKKINKIIKVLENYYKRRRGSANRNNPFHVLIACVLSQRTREENTEKAAKQLFKKAKTPKTISELSLKELKNLINPVGFYRQKAKRIKQICKILLSKYNAKVPTTRENLLKLPGVGWKTSAIVLSYGLGKPIVAVDTHVNKISKRLGLVNKKAKVEEVRKQLEKLFPKKKWYVINLGFVNFGREICKPIKPRCLVCPLNKICKYKQK